MVMGVGWLPASIGGGVRSTSMNYLTSTVLARSNLDMLINTRVTTLTYSSSTAPTVNGVTVAQAPTGTSSYLPLDLAANLFLIQKHTYGSLGQHYNITAAKQVVLSAGTIASAQLLMLSGIGDASALKAKGIASRYNNSNVGQNLIVHPFSAFLHGDEDSVPN